MQEEAMLTGRVTVEQEDSKKSFLLEAIIANHTTWLRVDGKLPEECLYHQNGHHSRLRIKSVLSSLPNRYLIGCNCGYEKIADDINANSYEKE